MQRRLEDCKLRKQVPRFVVGYRTFTDGSLAVDGKQSADVGADVTVPVGALAAGGDMVGLGDVGVGAGHRSETSGARGMSARGGGSTPSATARWTSPIARASWGRHWHLDSAWEAYAVPRGGDSADEEDDELEDAFVQAEPQAADDNGGGTSYSAEVPEGGESSGLTKLFALQKTPE